MTDIDRTSRKLAVAKFRDTLAAVGYRSFLLTDDEVWRWAEQVVAPLVKSHDQIEQTLVQLGRVNAR